MSTFEDVSMFPELVPLELPEPVKEKISKGRRLTMRQRADIDAGRHPLMRGLKLREGEETCGSCVRRVLMTGGQRSYPKCDLRGDTRSEATDCRAWWPACTMWQTKT